MITLPMWATTGYIDSVTTEFGDVCVKIDTNTDHIAMQLTHSFHSPPQSVTLQCPAEYQYASFNKLNGKRVAVKNGCVNVPLNVSVIYIT